MSKANILIVEDEAIVAADLAGMLERLGYGVSGMTPTGEEAVSLARELRPDLVLMDIRLAGAMDGIDAAEIIHRELGLPVIFLTAHSDHATLQRAKLSEPFGYLLKPFEELALKTHIEMAIYKHLAERRLRAAHDELELRIEERTKELKEAESRLRVMNEGLERRVAERTMELKEANDLLRESQRATLNMMEDAHDARRQAENVSAELLREVAARKQSEQLFRSMFERHKAVMLLVDTEGGAIVDANSSAVQFYGYSLDELRKMRITDINQLPPDDVVKELENAAAGEKGYFVFPHKLADGQMRWVEVYTTAVETLGRRLLFSIIHDITERKTAEEALLRSEAELRSAQDALWKANERLEFRIAQRTEELRLANRELQKKTRDLNGRVRELNCLNMVLNLLTGEGTPMMTVLNEVVQVIPSGWQFPERAGVCIVLNGLTIRTDNYSDTPWKLERPIHVHENIQGSLSVAYDRPSGHEDEVFLPEEAALAGTIAELIGGFVDRLQNRTLLAESEARYRRVSQQHHALLDALPDMLILLSSDLNILWGNKAAAVRAGLVPEDLVGRTCSSFWEGMAVSGRACPATSCLATGQHTMDRLGTSEGVIWDVMAIPVKDEAGTVRNVILVARDVTAELRLQEEAMRSARLASLGELAAGVAHEINNPINSVINFAQILSNKAERRSEEHEFAEEIIREGERIAGIVRGLLGFARDTRDVKQRVTLQGILNSTLVLTNAQLKRDGIRLKTDVPEDLPLIRANHQQLQQVFLNLISNARYALNRKYEGSHPDKVLDIRAGCRTIEGKPHLRVEVCDHGTGIPKEVQHKVTSPFFTTKPQSEGTGLGLSISHGIVADHGGQLTVESAEGEYTRVVIDIPAEGPEISDE